jgi:hypothetical protein
MNLLISGSDLRPHPYAMFAAIEADARLIWEVSPYISSLGKERVLWSINKVNSCALLQTLSFLKSSIRGSLWLS